MRGLLALLSPNEEVTLRRVALGSLVPHKLPADHLKRLSQLNLIAPKKGDYQLTPLGFQRYRGLSRAARATAESTRSIEQILSSVILSKEA